MRIIFTRQQLYGAIGFLGLFLLAAILVITFNPVGVYAVTTNESNASVSVTVNQYVDVTLTNITISFGSLDPGATNTANANNPLTVSIETTTNCATNLSAKATGVFSDGGSNSFGVGNMTYNNASSQTGEIAMNVTYSSPPVFANWINIAEPATQTNKSVWFWIDIPTGQTAAAYTTTVSLKTGVFA